MARIRTYITVLFTLMLLTMALLPARAATLTVTDCTSSEGAAGRLLETITAAADGDTIDFSCGTATIIFAAQIALSKSLTFNGGGTITLSGDNARGIFYIDYNATPYTITFNNLTFADGYSNYGGAIRNEASIVTINNSTFNSNEAYFGGAAIYNSGTMTINNSNFTNNVGNFDGALDNSLVSTTTITNSIFENNQASSTMAGGAISSGGALTITGSTIRNNTSGGGGTYGVRYDDNFSSQNTTYENNGCLSLGGSLNNQGGNVATNAPGCPGAIVTIPLNATIFCSGNNLRLIVYSGDSPYTISYTTTSTTTIPNLSFVNQSIPGPNTFTNVSIAEQGGNKESLSIASITCPGTVVVVPVVPVVPVVSVALSPDPNAVGCELTDLVENAPDNTYCRVLMRNGAVVSYSGAIPAELIGLGVKLAVDVYRLEGGTTVTTFPAYQQICLEGEGRFFYL
ncbi:MAG: hypothetical protein SFZ02_11275, partial [bacterium]|nr:hypothetical protein [bacterium]